MNKLAKAKSKMNANLKALHDTKLAQVKAALAELTAYYEALQSDEVTYGHINDLGRDADLLKEIADRRFGRGEYEGC